MSRIIIWSIVGIVIVLGVIFIVSTRKQAREIQATLPVSDKAYDAFATRFENRIDKVRDNVAKAKEKLGNPTPAMQAIIDELDTKVEEFSTAISELRSKTTTTEREEAVRHIRELNFDIRKLIRNIGGTTGTDTGD
jgi:peptidoglycan hydrolase CwlO-like protein